MNLRRTVLWITGRDILAKKSQPLGEYMFVSYPDNKWSLTFSADDCFLIETPAAPNFIHRAMQRVILGFRWSMK